MLFARKLALFVCLLYFRAIPIPQGYASPSNDTISSNISATNITANVLIPGGGSTPSPPPPPPQQQQQQRVVGSLISLLRPPPGFNAPNLTDAQTANIQKLSQLPQGTATVVARRSVGNLDGQSMACGFGYLNDYFKDNFVGIPLSLFSPSRCGVCVQLYCVDSICTAPLTSNRTFMITDSCQNCKGYDLVVSAQGLAALSGVNIDDNPVIQVAWEVLPSCGSLIEGTIKMLPSENNSKSFLGINFSNLKVLLSSVRVNGMEMKLQPYGYWTIEAASGSTLSLKPPYTLQLVGVNNQVLTVRLNSLQEAQDLGVNF